MPWECRLREPPNWAAGERPQIGDMWFDDYRLQADCPPALQRDLSLEYRRDWEGKRPPLVLTVPGVRGQGGYRLLPLDQHYTNQPPDGHGWTITGEPPIITASPSLNAVGDYHGWLQNGVLSDDVEGRTYPSEST